MGSYCAKLRLGYVLAILLKKKKMKYSTEDWSNVNVGKKKI